MDGWINKQESGHGFTERQHPSESSQTATRRSTSDSGCTWPRRLRAGQRGRRSTRERVTASSTSLTADRMLSIPDYLIILQIALLNSLKPPQAGSINLKEINVIVTHRGIPELCIAGFARGKSDQL